MKKKVRFNVSKVTATGASYRPGDIAVLDKYLADCWVEQGDCSDVENDAEDLTRQIAELQAQLKALGPRSNSTK
jgi:hypothetical protein